MYSIESFTCKTFVMSLLVPKTFSLLCNSDPVSGALFKSDDGSKFVVQLNQPISIPSEAVGVTLQVEQASVWNVSYNISRDIGNNRFVFSAVGVTHTVLIPDGQYSLAGFNKMLQRFLLGVGLAEDLIVLTGDDSNSRIIITFLNNTTVVDFSGSGTCREMLGFNSRPVPNGPRPAGKVIELADFTAQFNRVNSYVIQTDLVSDGIPVNNSASGVIANIQIDVKSGRLINYQPRHPTVVDATELAGRKISRFEVRLRDQNTRPVNTVGENYTVLIALRYLMPR